MSDIIQHAKQLAELGAPPMRAEIETHEDVDPRHAHDCLVRLIEKDDENGIWYEEEHGGYEHGKLHVAHVFAAAPEMAQAIAEETWEYSAQAKRGDNWETSTNSETHLEEWWQDKTDAEAAAARMQEQGHTTRIVERRVSTPEVISE